MGLATSLVKVATGGVFDSFTKLVGQFKESPTEANAHQLKMAALNLQLQLKQMEINETEAQHKSVFVAGARPATLWICAACMLGIVVAGVYGWFTGEDMSALYALYGTTVAPAHLGLLGLRSYEKSKGTATNGVSK